MISRPGTVIAIRDGLAAVAVDVPSACGACRSRSVCGTGGTGGARRVVQVPAAALRRGDTVALSLPDGALNRSALLAYLLPAAAFVAGALAGQGAGGGDGAAALGALLGLAAGLAATRLLARRLAPTIECSTSGEAK